jgi:myo-inositol-1(or 4)-monophosphatase
MQNNLLDGLREVCNLTGEFQMAHLRGVEENSIEDKGINQLVSFVDIESEKMLVDYLKKLRPDAGFITEENTEPENVSASAFWIIDPLDGTTNYLHGLQVFSISVALMEQGEMTAGIVHCPALGETFTALKNMGAHLNGEPIAVSQTATLKQSLIATGFPYYEFQHTDAYLELLGKLMLDTQGLRRMGSAAIDLVYTACGRFDGFYEIGLNAWDVAAGALILEEAGGRVTDFSGGRDCFFGRNIVAGNAEVQQQLLQRIASCFGTTNQF